MNAGNPGGGMEKGGIIGGKPIDGGIPGTGGIATDGGIGGGITPIIGGGKRGAAPNMFGEFVPAVGASCNKGILDLVIFEISFRLSLIDYRLQSAI